MKLKSSIILCALAGLLLSSCAGKQPRDGGGLMKVTASIAPVAYLAREIGGDSAEVQVLLPPGSDAESFEPQIGKLRDLEGASLFAATGLLPFEDKIASTVRENGGARFVPLSGGIELINGTHGDGEPDPHIWVSVRNLRVMGRTLSEAMAAARPAAAEYFNARHALLDNRLDSLDKAFSARLAGADNPVFLVWHPSLSYFARDYGLRQIAVGFEGKEHSAVGARERLDAALAASPKVYFLQAEEDPRAAETLPLPAGTRKVTINLMAPDWETEIKKVADALR